MLHARVIGRIVGVALFVGDVVPLGLAGIVGAGAWIVALLGGVALLFMLAGAATAP